MQSGGRQQFYDRHRRNPQSKQFYNSIAWRGPSGARTQYIREHPICERCNRVTADHVHHKIPIDTPEGWEARFDPTGFMSVCVACHNTIEAQIPQPLPPVITGMPTITEDEEYYYDEQAATAPIRFAAKYCFHWQGPLRGKPFILAPVQEQIIKPVFGFLHRETKLRRFTHLWIEGAIGCGKTPILALLGLQGLIADNEPGASVFCFAADHAQANYSFQCAKNFIKNGPLQSFVDTGQLKVNQYEITWAPTDSVWMITSGKGPKAGGAPSRCLADEIHQIKDRNVYDDLDCRMAKRSQPLMVCATNAANKPNSLYADLHEEAADTLTGGKRTNRRLFPVLWAAPREADPSSPDTWKIANPLLGITIQPEKVAAEWQRAKESPAAEARFRLLYLGQQVSDVQKWLDIHKYDGCVKPIDPNTIKGLPRYVGIDLSNGDDLCAQVDVYASQTFYVTSKFWLPQATADKYEQKNLHPYSQWAEQGAIQLLDQPTISIDVQTMIAQSIIDSHKLHPIEAVCFDTAYSSGVIPLIEKAGIKTIKVRQGYTLSAGCEELDRRLIEKSIIFEPNGVMRFCAENVEVTHNQHGQYWPVKEGHRNRSPGKAACKVDGISALCTALTEARKHNYAMPDVHIGAEAFSLD